MATAADNIVKDAVKNDKSLGAVMPTQGYLFKRDILRRTRRATKIGRVKLSKVILNKWLIDVDLKKFKYNSVFSKPRINYNYNSSNVVGCYGQLGLTSCSINSAVSTSV